MPVKGKTSIQRRKSAPKKLSNDQKIRKIVRQTLRSTAETKSYINGFNTSINRDTVYVTNPLLMTVGTGNEEVIGESFFLKNIYVRGEYVWNGTLANTARTCRFMLIETDTLLTASNTPVSVTTTDIFRTPFAFGTAATAMVDFDKVKKIHYDEVHTIDARDTAATSGVTPKRATFQLNVPIGKKLQRITSGFEIKDHNYHLVMLYNDDSSTVGGIIMTVKFVVNYTDM